MIEYHRMEKQNFVCKPYNFPSEARRIFERVFVLSCVGYIVHLCVCVCACVCVCVCVCVFTQELLGRSWKGSRLSQIASLCWPDSEMADTLLSCRKNHCRNHSRLASHIILGWTWVCKLQAGCSQPFNAT